jgi:hypothetical protein
MDRPTPRTQCTDLPGVGIATLIIAALLAGCGYVGEPLPPALKRPVLATDLTAVEHGSKINMHFTVPAVTTEGIAIRTTPDIELRIGPQPGANFDVHAWERSAERVPATEIHVSNGTASALVDASKYDGKTVLIGVRVHGPGGRDIGWSRFETVPVVQPLPQPEGLEAKDGPDSIELDWHAGAPLFRIYRKTRTDTDWTQIGTSARPSYSDTTIEYGKTYQYFVQSIEKTDEKYAESEDSATIAWTPVDKFAPAVPTGLTAVPGTRTIELVWERNVEKDFASYSVYRDGKRIAEMLGSPAFSDKDVMSGTTYRYQVTAVDASGNESAPSAAAEAAIP